MRSPRWLIGSLGALSLVASPRAYGACPDVSLGDALSAVDQAFARMDVEGFYASRDTARATLPCLSAPITPSLAASYHRMEALDAFLGRDDAGTVLSFRAAVAADPDTALPEGTAIEGHPLYDAFREASALPPSATEIARSDAGAVWVDGVQADEVPTERPAVIQVVGDEVRTAYAPPGSFPKWLEVGAPAPPVPEPIVVVPVPQPEPKKRRIVAPMAIASGATAVIAGGLLAGGLVVRSEFMDPATPYEDLEKLRTTANGLGIAAQVSAGVAIGFGAIAVVGAVR